MAEKLNNTVESDAPIVDVTILKEGEQVPNGWEKVQSTLNMVSSNLNSGCSTSTKGLYLAFRRSNYESTEEEEEENEGATKGEGNKVNQANEATENTEEKLPITDISVMWGFEAISGGWECIEYCTHSR